LYGVASDLYAPIGYMPKYSAIETSLFSINVYNIKVSPHPLSSLPPYTCREFLTTTVFVLSTPSIRVSLATCRTLNIFAYSPYLS